jgi:hypothetical protein
MKLFIIPVRVLDLPAYLCERLLNKTETIKVRTHDQKTFQFNISDIRMQITNNVLHFVIALSGHGAKDIDRFFFMNSKEELLYVSRPGIAMKNELEKLYVGEAL